ncbi:MAG: hypothetical protein Q9224_007107, partial [Gallowayella concinna]
ATVKDDELIISSDLVSCKEILSKHQATPVVECVEKWVDSLTIKRLLNLATTITTVNVRSACQSHFTSFISSTSFMHHLSSNVSVAQSQLMSCNSGSTTTSPCIANMAPKAMSSERGSAVESSHALRRSSRFQKLNKSMEPRPVTRSQASFSTAAETAKITTAASKLPTAGTTPFPFLALPPEIRNMIYRYIVRFPKGVVRTTNPTKSRLQLWYVNRQIYDEASAIFYHINTFIFYSDCVRKGEDPFGPRLDRIERCYLNLAWTQDTKRGNEFAQWFVKEFVTALLGWKSLKYFIVRIMDFQFDIIEPLQWLTGIDFVFIDRGYFSHLWRDGLSIVHIPPREQRLERLMMSDGTKTKRAILESLGEVYVSDPPLSTQLSGRALQKAQRHGGWANLEQLYDFLGI